MSRIRPYLPDSRSGQCHSMRSSTNHLSLLENPLSSRLCNYTTTVSLSLASWVSSAIWEARRGRIELLDVQPKGRSDRDHPSSPHKSLTNRTRLSLFPYFEANRRLAVVAQDDYDFGRNREGSSFIGWDKLSFYSSSCFARYTPINGPPHRSDLQCPHAKLERSRPRHGL